MADAEGKLGKQGKEDHTELPGEIKNGLGGVSDVLAGETGDEIKHTLGTISSVAAALGGLNSNNIVLGMGTGTGLKGTGPGGGGTGPGVPFGSGTLNTGWGFGNGGGFGSGSGGPGGAGKGGNGMGGTGSGTGSGNGTGERQVAVSSGAGSGSGGLSPRANPTGRDGSPRGAARLLRERGRTKPQPQGRRDRQLADRTRRQRHGSEPRQLFARQPEGRGVRRATGEGMEVSLQRRALQCGMAFQVRDVGRRLVWHGARSTKSCLTVLDLLERLDAGRTTMSQIRSSLSWGIVPLVVGVLAPSPSAAARKPRSRPTIPYLSAWSAPTRPFTTTARPRFTR